MKPEENMPEGVKKCMDVMQRIIGPVVYFPDAKIVINSLGNSLQNEEMHNNHDLKDGEFNIWYEISTNRLFLSAIFSPENGVEKESIKIDALRRTFNILYQLGYANDLSEKIWDRSYGSDMGDSRSGYYCRLRINVDTGKLQRTLRSVIESLKITSVVKTT